jgi:hypothetical protein
MLPRVNEGNDAGGEATAQFEVDEEREPLAGRRVSGSGDFRRPCVSQRVEGQYPERARYANPLAGT